jgi:hypothetical protein
VRFGGGEAVDFGTRFGEQVFHRRQHPLPDHENSPTR